MVSRFATSTARVYLAAGVALGGLSVGVAVADSGSPLSRLQATAAVVGIPILLAVVARLSAKRWLSDAVVLAVLFSAPALVPIAGSYHQLPQSRDLRASTLLSVLVYGLLVVAAPAAFVSVVAIAMGTRVRHGESLRRDPADDLGAKGLGVLQFASPALWVGVALAGLIWIALFGLLRTFSARAILISLAVAGAWTATTLRRWIEREGWRRLAVPVPTRLAAIIDASAEQAGVRFREVYLLADPGLATAGAAVALSPLGAPVLGLSQTCVEEFDERELRAVLLHEAAHVRLRHHSRRFWRGLLILAAYVLAFLAVSRVVGSFSLEGVPWLPGAVAAGTLTIPRMLWTLYVTRAFEAEADAFVVDQHAGPALLSALERIRTRVRSAGDGSSSEWTTHGAWDDRKARLTSRV